MPLSSEQIRDLPPPWFETVPLKLALLISIDAVTLPPTTVQQGLVTNNDDLQCEINKII
jgi:hypothetical protein